MVEEGVVVTVGVVEGVFVLVRVGLGKSGHLIWVAWQACWGAALSALMKTLLATPRHT